MKLHEKYNQITKSVTMTEQEKNAMRSSLVWHIRSNKVSAKIPFYNLPYVRFGMAFAFVILVSVSGVSFASQNALPGDISYPLKIKIEEIKGVTKTTPKAKIAFNKKRAETRLEEIKTLIVTDKADPEKIAIAQKEFEDHIEKTKENAKIVAKADNDADKNEVLAEVKKLEVSIEKNVDVISTLVANSETKDKKDDAQETLNTAISKNKDSITDVIREIALPKKSETEALDEAISNIENELEDLPAGTGADRSDVVVPATLLEE